MFAEPASRVRVGRADDLHAGAQRVADVLAAEVEAGGEAVDLERDAVLERDLEDALEVEGVLRAAADEPARRVAEAAHVRVAQRLLDALGHLRAAASAARRARSPAPSRARRGRRRGGRAGRRAGCRTRSRAGRGTARAARWPPRSPRAWRRTSSAVSPRTAPDGRRVVADRDVVVAALARGAAHLLDARPAVRPRRVAVQVAADVGSSSTSAGGSPRNGSSRSSGGHHGSAERAVDGRLVGRVGQRLERRDVRRRAGRAHERGPEALAARRRRARPARPRPSRRPRAARPARSPRRSAAARRSAPAPAPGPRAAQTTASRSHESRQRRTSPADLAAERRRDAAHELPGAVEQQPALRARLGLAGERLEQPRLGLRPDAGHGPQPPGGRRLAQLVGRADAERPRDLDRALRAEPEVAAEADEAGRELALELGQLGDRRRSRRARAAAPRSPGRSRAARAPARSARARRPGAGVARIVSAARR